MSDLDIPFLPFPKMARLNRAVTVTEKIDGTNAQIWISDDLSIVKAGSRSRWITPADDNYGFAAWVAANIDELRKLGPGQHFGEWWGQGIQRRYDLTEKRFSLFNTGRWSNAERRPACCACVPVLYHGLFEQPKINECLSMLREIGSVAAPGFMRPEGVVIFQHASGQMMKVTCEKDEMSKGEAEKRAKEATVSL